MNVSPLLAQAAVETAVDPMIIVLSLAFQFVLGGSIGFVIGKAKNRVALGVVLGALFGCIGWIILAVVPKAHSTK